MISDFSVNLPNKKMKAAGCGKNLGTPSHGGHTLWIWGACVATIMKWRLHPVSGSGNALFFSFHAAFYFQSFQLEVALNY